MVVRLLCVLVRIHLVSLSRSLPSHSVNRFDGEFDTLGRILDDFSVRLSLLSFCESMGIEIKKCRLG